MRRRRSAIAFLCIVGISPSFVGLFLQANDDPTVSPMRVNIFGFWIESDPIDGSAFQGKLTLVDDMSEGKRPISSEEWKYRSSASDLWAEGIKPPYITTYTLKARATGMGEIHMKFTSKNGGSTIMSHDVGTFRDTEDKPSAQEVQKVFYIRHLEKHETIHSYEDPYQPSIYDTCYPVKNKGYETEVSSGTETLAGSGEVSASKIKVVYGSENAVMTHFGLSGSWPPVVGANIGYGETSTEKWMWSIEEDPSRNSDPVVLDGSFSVEMLDPVLVSPTHPHQEAQPCTKCPNCGASVHTETDHAAVNDEGELLVCPDHDGAAPGCGQYIWNCNTGRAVGTR